MPRRLRGAGQLPGAAGAPGRPRARRAARASRGPAQNF